MASREQLNLLRVFTDLCKSNADVLHMPELNFFKEWLESMGATLPPPKPKAEAPGATEADTPILEPDMPEAEMPAEPEEESDPESDVELDNSGVIEKDTIDETIPMGDSEKEVTEEMEDESSEIRSKALQAMSEGNNEESLRLFGQAIEVNPKSAILHAKRASVLIKMGKPMTAIRDCDKALQLNPDSAAPYKFRGRANRLVGNWEQAHKDLAQACKLDYDDQTNDWLKEVVPNAKKIQEHKRKVQRKREEKELKERQKAHKARQEAHAKAQADAAAGGDDDDEDMGPIPPGMANIFSDPEIVAAFQDPEVAKAFADIQQNPANMMKHQANPKVKNLMEKIAKSMGGGMGGGGGGFPGMFGGGMGGMGAGMGGMGAGMDAGMPDGDAAPSGPPPTAHGGPDLD